MAIKLQIEKTTVQLLFSLFIQLSTIEISKNIEDAIPGFIIKEVKNVLWWNCLKLWAFNSQSAVFDGQKWNDKIDLKVFEYNKQMAYIK